MTETVTPEPHDADWSEQWPTEPGFYWFYGHWPKSLEPRLQVVQVVRDRLGEAVRVSFGAFMYPDETGAGLWRPIELPTLPPLPDPEGAPQ